MFKGEAYRLTGYGIVSFFAFGRILSINSLVDCCLILKLKTNLVGEKNENGSSVNLCIVVVDVFGC
ncbi:MAG: hypothetical protein LBL39_04505 [Planctomycetaceae bacterium]|nr:hypothetical protein [Planctomycetaceae bacterium]